MDNPLLLKRPDSLVEQIHAYARDLAYLVVHGECQAKVYERDGGISIPYLNPSNAPITSSNVIAFQEKWGAGDNHNSPSLDLLASFGYLERQSEVFHGNWFGDNQPPTNVTFYIVTEKAFSLLEKPIRPPEVFISYRRVESSAFALLIEARLRIAGVENVFIDKDIKAGDEWHGEIQEKISQCQYFISLIGPKTLESDIVIKEIEWAVKCGARIIPIAHNGWKINSDCPPALQKPNAIEVTGESAREYETAISQLLNDMGYATY